MSSVIAYMAVMTAAVLIPAAFVFVMARRERLAEEAEEIERAQRAAAE
jgi:hypothetical protein